MVIRGEANIIKIYDYSYLISLDEYDLTDSRDLERLKESVASFLESQEADALTLDTDLNGIIPDTAEIEIDDRVYGVGDIEYKNINLNDVVSENFKEGDLVLILSANGDGYFEYEENPNISELKIGYTACDIEGVDNNFYETFCDLILPNEVELNGEKLEVIASNFYPKSEMMATLYVVKGGVLERVVDVDILHDGWDLIEDIIQVEYD